MRFCSSHTTSQLFTQLTIVSDLLLLVFRYPIMSSATPDADKAPQVQSMRDEDASENHARKEKDVDDAYRFLVDHSESTSSLDIRRIQRKVDWRIVPIMFLIYLFNLFDKVSLNYAAVMGLPVDLKLRGNEFTNAATVFFGAYLIAELPTPYILNKVPAGKWLGANVVLWGIATACTAAAKDYSSLLAARVFLGAFEAPVAPCLMLISSQWYTKPQQAPRFAFWYCGLGCAQIIGGILSFAFQQIEGASLAGWRLMFVVLGCLTVVLGFVALWNPPDSPMSAKFLNDAEKTALLQHVSDNQTGVRARTVKKSQIVEAAKDPQLWLLALMTITVSLRSRILAGRQATSLTSPQASISSGVVSTYSATLIAEFGFQPDIAALLNTPSGLVSIVSSLAVGYGVRQTSNRWVWYVACCIPGMIGGGLMSFLPLSKKGGLLAGVYMVNVVVPTALIVYQYAAANVAGHTKRAFSTTLVAFAFGVGNILGPQTFQARDAPQFIPAKITVLATQGCSALLAVCLYLYYRACNSRKERGVSGERGGRESEKEKWANKTDKQNSSFRYVY